MKAVVFDERIPSDRRPDRAYRVTGSLSCECTGFGTYGYCKHLRRYLDSLMAPSRKARATSAARATTSLRKESPPSMPDPRFTQRMGGLQ